MVRLEELKAHAVLIASGPIIPKRTEIDRAGEIMARIISDITNMPTRNQPTIEIVGDRYRLIAQVDGISTSYVEMWSSDVAQQIALDFEAEEIQWECNIVAEITLTSRQRSVASYITI